MRNWLEIERLMMDQIVYGGKFPYFYEMEYEICNGLTEEQLKSFWREVKNWVMSGQTNTSPARQKMYKEELLMSKAEELIDKYCKAEFDYGASFENLKSVGLAYTTITDNEIDIQVNANLIDYRIEKYLNDIDCVGEPNEVIQFDSLQEMVDWMDEGNLYFDYLICVEDETIEKLLEEN